MPNIPTLICIISYLNIFIGLFQVCRAETSVEPATFNKFNILQKKAIKSGVDLNVMRKGMKLLIIESSSKPHKTLQLL